MVQLMTSNRKLKASREGASRERCPPRQTTFVFSTFARRDKSLLPTQTKNDFCLFDFCYRNKSLFDFCLPRQKSRVERRKTKVGKSVKNRAWNVSQQKWTLRQLRTATVKNNFNGLKGFCTENGSRRGRNLALTGSFVPNSFDSGKYELGRIITDISPRIQFWKPL